MVAPVVASVDEWSTNGVNHCRWPKAIAIAAEKSGIIAYAHLYICSLILSIKVAFRF